MKRLFMLVTVIVAVILVSSLLISCTEPEETQTPTTTQPTTTTSPTTQPPETILIRMTTPVPPGDVLANMAQEGMDRFNARTNGLYEMKMFPGGQLVAFPESLDAIRTGAIEGGVIPLAAFGGSIPEFGLPELPFLYNNGEANAEAVIGIGEIWKEVLEEKANQTSVATFTIGGMNLLCSKKMITSLDDFEGLVVGCDTPSAAMLVEGLGGSGIVVDFTEDYSNLQKGVFDAKTSAPQYIEIAKLYEVAQYYTVFYGLGSLYAITINMDIYNAMPQEIKDILQEEMTATAAAMSEYFVNSAYNLQPVLEAEGLQYYFLPADERDKWKAMVYPGSLAALEDAGDIGASIKAIIDEANAKYPYVE
jgi:TRAP-type C4-dicarboxylate transport system substrate-binding protein